MRVLAVGAHPDDIEYGCGGALLCHVGRGDTVTMVVVTDGARGGDPLLRAKEQRQAALLLGASLKMLGQPDGEAGPTAVLVELLEDVLRSVSPDVVYTHLPDETHQDHVATYVGVRAAARGVRSVLLFESPRSAALATGLYVDITRVVDQKAALVATHTSQYARDPSLTEAAVRTRASFHGVRFGVPMAEVFSPLRFEWRLGDTGHHR